MDKGFEGIYILLNRFIPVTVNTVTTIPANKTPANIAISAFLKLKPNTKAAAHPVHAPVAGKGMPTNTASPIEPYFSNSALCL